MLTIELVPSTAWYRNLRSELSRKDWDFIRRKQYKQAGFICEACGGRGKKWPVECHEVWEFDDAAKVQRLVGLVALCPDCHAVKHMGFANSRGRGQAAKDHLAKVNGWTLEQTELYVTGCFDKWEERSKYQWELDLAWLQDNLSS